MDVFAKKAKQIFQNYLKSKNLKVTGEREQILDAVFSTHDHIDAEELLIRFRKKKIQISRSTIYRTLELLVECQLVKKLSFDKNPAYYEHIFGHEHHDHLLCKDCGKIIEFYNQELEILQAKICREHQFQESEHSLKIFGICHNCQNEKLG